MNDRPSDQAPKPRPDVFAVSESDNAAFSEQEIVLKATPHNREEIVSKYKGDGWLKNRALNAWEYANGLTSLSSYPTDIILPCVNICNADCIMCNLKKKTPVFLDSHTVHQRYSHIIPFATQLGIASFGEPFLNPHLDQVLTSIGEYSDPRCNIYITTNGILLKDKFDILKNRVTNINISLNAATPETHERVMGIRGVFDNVTTGVTKAVSYRERSKKYPRVNISAVVTRDNIHEIPEFIELGNRLGVDSIYLRALMPTTNCAFARARNEIVSYAELVPYHHKNFPFLMDKIHSSIKNSKTNVICTDPVLNKNDASLSNNFPFDGELADRCFRPYTTALFFGDFGETVQPCCFMSNNQTHELTFPAYESENEFFDPIWNGSFFTSLRKSFIDKEVWETCRSCFTKI